MKMTGAEVRQKFIDYFKRNQHTHVASSSLIPEGDQTLLFTNSGMVQFKNVFLGLDKRSYSRATTHQKSVRAGGKHNDLENVGHTARHHTFFEMLGNFSFGDYFKKEAIRFAWEFITVELKIPKEKLYVTVFREDDEAFNIWNKQEGIPPERISRFDEKDNFWQMADTGPCGPCSEIFYDHGPAAAGPDCNESNCKVGCSCDRYVEIWNLVFMQFNRDDKGVLHPLPRPSVDTGAGLERMTAVMQGVPSNYDTDLFRSLIQTAEDMSRDKNGKKVPYAQTAGPTDVAYRVLADHARSAAFLIADGVLPSNEGRGYVLRRILRRGIRFAQKINISQSLIVPVVKKVIETMSVAYPELLQHKNLIVTTVGGEESRFLTTLDQGTQLLTEELKKLKASQKTVLPGDVVFKLYDTYGFPADLTRIMSEEAGVTVDEKEFESHMDQARTTAKASWKGAAQSADQGVMVQLSSSLPKTDFVGYQSLSSEGTVLELISESKKVNSVKAGQKAIAAFSKTCFYAEGGGQVGDVGIGSTLSANKTTFEIHDTKKVGDVFFHFIEVKSGELKKDDKVQLEVTDPIRQATMRNHSATHLMHAALRKVLGTHVTQAGSLVEEKRTRFDFTHPKPVTKQEIEQIEALVNAEISASHDVDATEETYKEAVGSGVMALFGEKYGDRVRVLRMGGFSAELCGGTHVHNTSEIRLFKIVSESGVSSGVRRIEAITGDRALEYLLSRHHDLSKVEDTLRTPQGTAVERIGKLEEQIKKLEKDLKTARTQSSQLNVDELVNKAPKISSGGNVVAEQVNISDRDSLSQLSDQIKDKLKSGVVILIGESDEGGPSPIVVNVTKDMAGKVHAGNLLKELAGVMGGKGGGRPDFAQGSAPDKSKAQQALTAARQSLGL